MIWALLGCGSKVCPLRPYTDPQSALRGHAATRQPVVAISAEARVDQRGSEGRIRGTVLMFVERTGRVRFDGMTSFGPAAILTNDGELFAFADLREKRFYRGPSCPANIARLLGLRMSARQVALVLLGSTPLLQASHASIGCADEAPYRIVLTSVDGSRQEIDLGVRDSELGSPPERQQPQLLRSELYGPDGRTQWRATFDDHRMVAADGVPVSVPYSIRVEQPAGGTDILLRFKRIELNPEIPVGAFVQDPRPGMRLETVRCE